MNNQDAYQQAKERLEAKYGFYIHLSVYLAVNLLLVIINLSKSSEGFWFIYPLFGWGIGLAFHALSVFVFAGRGFQVTEEMIEKEMNKGVNKT
ncbi:MAG: 2TM domain-containing protein [Pyrinomonadaceae bacterium]|nr:2TM domain-containing protein [Pyrinomonadaceae bacterium]